MINVISLPVSSRSTRPMQNSISAPIDRGYTTLYITCRVHKWTLCEVSSGNEYCASESSCKVPHCGCGSATLEIKRGDIMFKQWNVLCSSLCHRWTDEVISFSWMICSATDQQNCIGGKEKDSARGGKKAVKNTLFSIGVFDYSLVVVTIVMIYTKWKIKWSGQTRGKFNKYVIFIFLEVNKSINTCI